MQVLQWQVGFFDDVFIVFWIGQVVQFVVQVIGLAVVGIGEFGGIVFVFFVDGGVMMVVVVFQYVDFVGFVVYYDDWLVVDLGGFEIVGIFDFVFMCDLDLGFVEDFVYFCFEDGWIGVE